MNLRFSATAVSDLSVGDMVSKPHLDGGFSIYTITEISPAPSRPDDRTRIVYDQRFEYVNKTDKLLAAIVAK